MFTRLSSVKKFNLKNFSKVNKCIVDNPYTLETFMELPYVDKDKIPNYIESGKSAKYFLNSIPLDERIKICQHALKWFKNNQDKIASEISCMMGKPVIQARREVDTMIDRAENLYKLAPEVMNEDNISIDSENILKIKKESMGLTFLISPWNYPLLTVIGALIPSILCGNPVILKHSPRTPLVGNYFEEAFKSVGALNVVQHLFLSNEDVPDVYKHEDINFVGFTGSVETGRKVLKDIAMANRFINTTFELGGKDAAYVCEDADIQFAVENIVDGAMYNSGQSCCAIERVFVHASVYDEFVEKAAEFISSFYKLGDPLDAETNLGPMALPDAPIILKEHIDEAISSGAELVLGGNIVKDANNKGRFFEPTLLKECNNDMLVMRKESFGPIIPVAKVENDDEAIDLINTSEYGLTSAIYSKDYKRASQISTRLNTGTVFLNRCDYLHPLLAHSGRKNSGVGCSLSKYGFSPFYKFKSINFKLAK